MMSGWDVFVIAAFMLTVAGIVAIFAQPWREWDELRDESEMGS